MKTKSLNQLKIWTLLLTPTVVLLLFFKVWIQLIMGMTDDPTKLAESITAATPVLVIINNLLLFGILLFALRTERFTFKSIGLTWNSTEAAIGVGLGIGLFVFQQYVTLPILAKMGLFNYWTGLPSITYVIGATLIGGFLKEAIFHGYGVNALEKAGTKSIVILIVTTAAFAIFHYGQGWSGVISAAIMGAVLGAYYIKRRNLTAVVIANALASLLYILFMTYQA